MHEPPWLRRATHDILVAISVVAQRRPYHQYDHGRGNQKQHSKVYEVGFLHSLELGDQGFSPSVICEAHSLGHIGEKVVGELVVAILGAGVHFDAYFGYVVVVIVFVVVVFVGRVALGSNLHGLGRCGKLTPLRNVGRCDIVIGVTRFSADIDTRFVVYSLVVRLTHGIVIIDLIDAALLVLLGTDAVVVVCLGCSTGRARLFLFIQYYLELFN